MSYPKMLIRSLLFGCVLAFALPSAAFAQRVTAIDPQRSNITFVSKQMNVPVEGKFGKFNVQISFDPAKIAQSSVTLDVEVGSIDTGSEEANDEVKSKSWFDVKKYPIAKFVSTGVKALSGGRYEAAGNLTIKNQTKPVSAAFTFKPEGQGGVFEGAFVLKRLDYGIGEGTWSDTDTVANEVQVKFRITGTSGTTKK
jgi:polyisoprenoid-binding protein YceI